VDVYAELQAQVQALLAGYEERSLALFEEIDGVWASYEETVRAEEDAASAPATAVQVRDTTQFDRDEADTGVATAKGTSEPARLDGDAGAIEAAVGAILDDLDEIGYSCLLQLLTDVAFAFTDTGTRAGTGGDGAGVGVRSGPVGKAQVAKPVSTHASGKG